MKHGRVGEIVVGWHSGQTPERDADQVRDMLALIYDPSSPFRLTNTKRHARR